MALSLDTVSSPDTSMAALQRRAAMPPEKHLDMPTQSLRRWSKAGGAVSCDRRLHDSPWLARLFVFGGALLLTAYGSYEMYQVVSVSRTTVRVGAARPLHHQLLVDRGRMHERHRRLPGPSQATAAAGVPAEALASRTAIVMPVYNEQTARTFAAVEAIRRSVDATGLGGAFDYFIVSDIHQPRRLDRGGTRLPGPAEVGSDRTRGSTIATGRRTTIARRATSLTSYAAGAGTTTMCSSSMRTA